ncbi:hypothetical protein FDN01_03315 [Acinetobacter baumannii]|nr:hypothetical protein FDN01_03315 [Acinetobacter baumannii]
MQRYLECSSQILCTSGIGPDCDPATLDAAVTGQIVIHAAVDAQGNVDVADADVTQPLIQLHKT